MLKILTSLPVEMTLGDALDKAKRLKKETELEKDRIKSMIYHDIHRDEIILKKRKARADKKLKLQAASSENSSDVK